MPTTKVPNSMVLGYPRGQVTLVDAATVAIDGTLGSVYDLAMGGNRTLSAPTGMLEGQPMLLRLKASGGSRSPTFDGVFRPDANTTLPTSISSGKTVYVMCINNHAAGFVDVVSVSGEV